MSYIKYLINRIFNNNLRHSNLTKENQFVGSLAHFNHLIATLKPQSNRPSYCYMMVCCSVHWPLMGGLLHLVQRGGAWMGWGPTQSPRRCTKCNSPLINSQCTNVVGTIIAFGVYRVKIRFIDNSVGAYFFRPLCTVKHV